MNSHRFILPLIVAFSVFLAGCPTEEPAVAEKVEEKAEEKVAAITPEGLAIDPSILPPPRPALESAPDLSGASMVINEATLAKMSADAVPAEILDSLKSLEGREFSNATELADAVRGAAGGGADPYMDRILRNALIVDLADSPPAPEGQLSIAQREQEAKEEIVAAVVMPGPFRPIYFDFDQSNIKPEFEAAIRENARMLLDDADMSVTIEGHCDERGTNEYNLALGQRRAESVRRALMAEGVAAGQLQTISYGEERPVALGHNEDSWWQNRRGIMVVN